MVTDGSGKTVGSMFKGQAVQEESRSLWLITGSCKHDTYVSGSVKAGILLTSRLSVITFLYTLYKYMRRVWHLAVDTNALF